jgi:hypothetical protein
MASESSNKQLLADFVTSDNDKSCKVHVKTNTDGKNDGSKIVNKFLDENIPKENTMNRRRNREEETENNDDLIGMIHTCSQTNCHCHRTATGEILCKNYG